MLDKIMNDRGYPDVTKRDDGSVVDRDEWQKRREEIISLLETHSYGKTPEIPVKVSGKTVEKGIGAYAGKVIQEKVEITLDSEKGKFTFPIELFIPEKVNKPPVFLHLAFRPVPDRYIPVEEITDQGFALAVLVYTDVQNDNLHGDFCGGLAEYFGTTSDRRPDEWGKIGMWAYAGSRVLDYIKSERDDIDAERVAVVGHSRLGKTALWCAARDERFFAAISNNSGYGGAASSKCGEGERVDDFIRAGSWDWYCENFKKYRGELEDEKPYDQAQLLSLVAPRYLCVGSAALDRGADPKSEFLTTLNASKVWELMGEKGLVTPDRLPEVGEHFCDGKIGYHLRDGRHFLSREDWNAYIDFLNNKFEEGRNND